MSFVSAKCTSCGATLQVDDSMQKAFCSCCGAQYVVEQAVHYYNTSNYYDQHTEVKVDKVEHMEVHVSDSSSVDSRLKNAEDYLVILQEHEKAEHFFRAIAEDAGGDWRAWWGIVRAKTKCFSVIEFCNGLTMKRFLDSIEPYVTKAKKCAPEETCKEIEATWNAYMQGIEQDTRSKVGENIRSAFAHSDPSLIDFDSLDFFRLSDDEYLACVKDFCDRVITGVITLDPMRPRGYIERPEFADLKAGKEIAEYLSEHPNLASRFYGEEIYRRKNSDGKGFHYARKIKITFALGKTIVTSEPHASPCVAVSWNTVKWAQEGRCICCGGAMGFFSNTCKSCYRNEFGKLGI